MQRKEMRYYGMTVQRFAEVMKSPTSLTSEEAKEVTRLFKERYPQIRELMEGLKKRIHQ